MGNVIWQGTDRINDGARLLAVLQVVSNTHSKCFPLKNMSAVRGRRLNRKPTVKNEQKTNTGAMRAAAGGGVDLMSGKPSAALFTAFLRYFT